VTQVRGVRGWIETAGPFTALRFGRKTFSGKNR
jgi:hypothetical protein